MSSRITVTTVKALAPGETHWDTDVAGFGVRRQRRHATYVLKTRIDGRIRWFTIGRHGVPWTPDTARRQARMLLGQIAQGLDPAEIRGLRKAALTITELIDRFLEEHVATKLKPRTQEEYRSLFERFLRPRLGDRRVPEVNPWEIAALHHDMRATPRQANHLLAVTRRMFSWAEARGIRVPETNPCSHVGKFPERGRERYLGPAELVRLGEALERAADRESPHAIAAIRLLLLTGARRSEVLTMLWSQVDFERGMLLLPDSKTGARSIFLATAAIDVLRGVPRLEDNPHVVCGSRPGGHLVGIGHIWRRIAGAAGLDDVRLHDLRHTFASTAIANEVPLATIGALLGHRRPDTTARYAHLAADPVRAAGERVAEILSAGIGAIPGSAPDRTPSPDGRARSLLRDRSRDTVGRRR